MKEIPLTQGYVALVDDEDFERVNAFKWFAVRDKRKVYARRSGERVGKSRLNVHMHRFILGCDKQVDHIDDNGLNNQKRNLRLANDSQNRANQRKQSRPTTSKFKGVSWHRAANAWVAQIGVNGTRKHIGTFKDEVDAAQAYNFMAEEIFGEFASYNTPLT